jgi:hypothetical protein
MVFQTHKVSNKRTSEKGSALVYILIAIALLAALTVSFMEPSSQQTSSQSTFKSVSALQGQIDTIRSAIQECVLIYPNGDSTVDTTTGTGTDPDANTRFPIKPNSTHLPTTGSYRAANRNVSNLRCPGNNDGLEEQHRRLFGGSTGKFMPPAPDLFEDWQYYNGQDGVYFWIRTTKSDAFLTSALDKLDAKYSDCEVDVIDATGGAVSLDDAGTAETTCANGETCFRVWLISTSPAGQHQDTGSNCHL